ncbi:MAG: hypothetical protein ACKVH7_08020, partial [Alphaproteobacteria bacterium]
VQEGGANLVYASHGLLLGQGFGLLERIKVAWNRQVVPRDFVNPLYLNEQEHLHATGSDHR